MKLNIILIIALIRSGMLFGQEISSANSMIFLREIAEDAEIISLGESTHGDGTTFEKKINIIKYLHDSCGYNLLMFESPLYDGEISHKNIQNVSNPFLKSIYGIWGTEELVELQTYILSTFSTPKPLHFAGFDCQFGAYYSQNGHVDISFKQLQDTLSALYPAYQKDASKNFYHALSKLVRISGKFNTISDDDTLLLSKEFSKISNLISSNSHRYFKLWNQIIKCLSIDYKINNMKAFESGLRDSMMFQNFEWVKNNYKDNKVIIWAATAHTGYSSLNKKIQYLPTKTMGEYLKEKYHAKYYAIGFSAYQGRISTSKLLQYKLPTSKTNSFEGEMQKLVDSTDAFVNMRNKVNKDYFDNKILSSRLLFSDESQLVPSLIVDGVYYFKTMSIPRHLNGRFKYSY